MANHPDYGTLEGLTKFYDTFSGKKTYLDAAKEVRVKGKGGKGHGQSLFSRHSWARSVFRQ